MNPLSDASVPSDADKLADAFRAFNRVSAELSDAYAGLQAQVERLTAELATANGELRRQYQEKAALTERLTLLLDALPAGVIVLNRDGAIEKSNPAATELFGQSLEGRRWHELAETSLRGADAPGESLLESGRRVAVAETQLDSAGGRIVLLHDITDAHQLKAQAGRNERLAAMGEMAASVAHQLRTPLAAALLFAGNLQRPELALEERQRCADRTVDRLKALERLIQDMLLFARGEFLGQEVLEAGALAAEVSRLIEPLARDKNIAFTAATLACTACVVGNHKALAGALTNLLENAVQASESGGRVVFDVRAERRSVRFSVRDTGRGVDTAVQARLFEPFFTTRAEGTGLGLAIARGVARAHGGRIEFASIPDQGSEFVMVLPARPRGPE